MNNAGNDPTDLLRRELMALHGLLYFSVERQYPPSVQRLIDGLIAPRAAELERRERVVVPRLETLTCIAPHSH
ncbi:MAG TPA: hypothetical protein VMH34_10625 [Gammaproteobacteria bacterium]|nr:hypothetical protein [Gammaproteobacteria bacterium]